MYVNVIIGIIHVHTTTGNIQEWLTGVIDQETGTLIYIPIVHSIHLHVILLSFSIKCENPCEKRKLKRFILYEQNKNLKLYVYLSKS